MADPFKEAVAWDQLQGAHGSAEEVGELLWLIESGEEAWGDLIDEVLHQGSLYEATAPAVFWVIRFLDGGGLAGQSAPRRKGAGRKQIVSPKRWAFIFLSAAAAAAISESTCAPQLAQGVLEALRQGAALYEKGLADPEVEVRLASAATWKIVAADGVDRAHAFDSIAGCYEQETDGEVRATLLSALNALAENGERWNHRLLAIVNASTSDHETFHAAAYLTLRLAHATPSDIGIRLGELYAGLTEAKYVVELTNLEEADDLFWASVQAMERPTGVACLAKALELCHGQDSHKTLGIVERLLRLASDDKRSGWGGTASSRGPKIEYFGVSPSDARAWLRSPEARLAMAAIVSKGEVWRIETNLFSLFGLPSGRNELRELAGAFPVD